MSETAFRLLLVWEVVLFAFVLLVMTTDMSVRPMMPSRLKRAMARAVAALLMGISLIGIVGNLYWAVWGGLNG